MRSLFPQAAHGIYLQTGGLGLVPLRTHEAVERVGRLMTSSQNWSAPYHEDFEGLRDAIGAMVNVPSDDVTYTRGTAHGLSLVSQGLDWEPGDNVVGARYEYPANTWPWTLLARHGVETRLVDPVLGRYTPDLIFDRVDERTRVVSLSWVQFWNGYRADLTAIGRECRDRGVLFVVDGIQGVGALQLDATAASIDVLACGASKWLLGVPGIGFCSIRRDVQDRIHPALVGAGTLALRPGEPFEDLTELKPDARRYEESGVSWLDVAAMKSGVDLLREIGIADVEEHVVGLSTYAAEALTERGYRIVEPWPRTSDESSGMISVFTGEPAAESQAKLDERGINVRLLLRQNAIRISTHIYNTQGEIDEAVRAIAECVAP